ncbi:hypothetical protein V2H45_02255 [Tumidithrix elongata RA019]|uniref:Uncharacterized protein n=1 Tax=Tumidithrix elongata BACA0141 TaxID=2716417 RepID=A0AAW9PU08_9CYAN|nr:hypothetical protein [Tumidithrix elongata RA019]
MMKVKWLLAIALFFLTLTLVIQGGKMGKVDLLVQSTQAQTVTKTDFQNESTPFMASTLYRNPTTLFQPVAPSGAKGVNIKWENGQSQIWYIEEQKYGEELIIAGIINNNPTIIETGFKMFDWGFARQASDGSFPGTSDDFHSTSFFVQAVARSMLFIQQSPVSSKYSAQVAKYKPLVLRAARWMITPDIWTIGIKRNLPYTHRRYLVAAALGLTGKLTGDQELITYARTSLNDGISLQLSDGVNPEKGGYDSSYQMVGLVYAQRWVSYFPSDSITPKVITMINKGLNWEKGRILATGEISDVGNTRTGPGLDVNRTGNFKPVDNRFVVRGFAYWASATGNNTWQSIASRIASFYYT